MDRLNLLDKWRVSSTHAGRPLQASLELTFQCNERCTHCYLEKFTDDQDRKLTREQWFHCLDELRSAGVMYLILMGGEAMLNPYFWDIAARGSQMGFHVSMITNGQKIKDLAVAQKLKAVGMSNVTISLYSMDSKIHDAMTSVPGSHARTMAAIDHLRQAGLVIGVNCLLTKANIDGFFDVADWCIERQIEIKADPNVTPRFGGDLRPTLLRASKEQLQVYYKKLIGKWPDGAPKAVIEDAGDHVCNAGKGKCAVTPHGELLTCIEVRESLGRLTENSFAELWSGPIAQKWRNFKVGELKGRDCNGTEHFCDHCPGMALQEDKDPLHVSQFSKMVAQVKREAAEAKL